MDSSIQVFFYIAFNHTIFFSEFFPFWLPCVAHRNLSSLLPKTKKRPQQDGGGIIVIKSNPYLLDGCLTNWKTIIPQKFSHRSERMSPMSGFPALRSGNRKRNPQRICLWRPVWFDHRNSTSLEETETPLLEGAHRVFCTPGPRGEKSSDPVGYWGRLTC